jgi:hypothetical protein
MMGFLLSLHLFFLFIISSGKFMAAIRHPATPIVLAGSRVARFFLVLLTKMGEIIPNDHIIYKMTIK